MTPMNMTSEKLREANAKQALRVPSARDMTVLGVEKPIVFRLREASNNRLTLLCQALNGVIQYNLWNTREVPLSMSCVTGASGQRPLITHAGWQRHVADWLASSMVLIEDVDFDG